MTSFNGTTWIDKSGKGGSTTLVNVVERADSPNNFGTACGMTYLSGSSTSSSIVFNTAALSAPYSVCTVSRYQPGGVSGRIFSTTSANWLHGHYNNRTGPVWMGTYWNTLTDANGPVNNPAIPHWSWV